MSNIDNSNSNDRKQFKEEEYVGVFSEHLSYLKQEITYKEPLITYRTQDDFPIDNFGQAPNGLRKRKGVGRKIGRKYTEEEIELMTYEERTIAVGKFGLSCNTTVEAAEKSFLEGLKKLTDRNASKEEIDEYIFRRGKYICKLVITPEHALVTQFRNSHANIYLYEGIDLEDCRDKSFEPILIDYQKYVEGQ